MKLKPAAILFFSSPGEVLEMVYYHFINSLRASRCTKSETLSEFRTDEKLGILNQMFWSENEKMFYKRTTLPQTNCSRRTWPPPPQIVSHTRRGSIGSTKVLPFKCGFD